MHRLIIHKLGPVDDCDITCTQFMTFTGFQASGKSTIAKAIFYFRTMKDDIYEIAKEQALRKQSAQITSGPINLKKMFLDKLHASKPNSENSLQTNIAWYISRQAEACSRCCHNN